MQVLAKKNRFKSRVTQRLDRVQECRHLNWLRIVYGLTSLNQRFHISVFTCQEFVKHHNISSGIFLL